MDYKSLADDDLVRECGERPCPEAWAEFIQRFQPTIAKVAWRMLLGYSQATQETLEEMVQNVFIKLCADDRAVLRRFRPQHPNAFYGLLKRITVNVVYDYLRDIKDDETEEWDEDANPIPDPRPVTSAEDEIFGSVLTACCSGYSRHPLLPFAFSSHNV